ncbi:MAG: hypothetical protein E7337_11285 [Clostridiales bacterium]|nr:hypothetical protein [Clostridiales bacterium]
MMIGNAHAKAQMLRERDRIRLGKMNVTVAPDKARSREWDAGILCMLRRSRPQPVGWALLWQARVQLLLRRGTNKRAISYSPLEAIDADVGG